MDNQKSLLGKELESAGWVESKDSGGQTSIYSKDDYQIKYDNIRFSLYKLRPNYTGGYDPSIGAHPVGVFIDVNKKIPKLMELITSYIGCHLA